MNWFEFEELRGASRRAGRHDLVAGRKNRNAHRAADLDLCEADRGADRHVLWPEASPVQQNDMSLTNILSRGPHIRAKAKPLWETNVPGGVDPDVLLHEDRICPFRNRRPGEDFGPPAPAVPRS